MQAELVGCDLVWGESVLQQRLEEGNTFDIGDAPADLAAAEDVEDYLEVEAGPFGAPHQLCDVPGPDLVGSFGQQFGLLIGGVAELGAALADFTVLSKDAVNGSDRAEVEILVEQAGVDFGGRLVGEAWRVQQVEDALLLRGAGRDGVAGWRARRPSHRRPRSPSRGPAGSLRALWSLPVVARRQRQPQPLRHFFLNLDDGLGAGQPPGETGMVALQLGHLGG